VVVGHEGPHPGHPAGHGDEETDIVLRSTRTACGAWKRASLAARTVGAIGLVVGGLGLATFGSVATSGPAGAITTNPCGAVPPLPTRNLPGPGQCVGPAIACDPQPTTTTAAPTVVPAVLPEAAPPTTGAPKVLGAQLASTGANTRILEWVAPALIIFGALAVSLGSRRRRPPTKR